MPSALESRLIDLESRLTHQEAMVDDLSDVIAAQDRTIARLVVQIRHLAGALRDVELGSIGSPADDKPPPHY
ncbi:SlyX family protein [Rhodospirillum rubrum]|uniref:Protein SlyX homolog n=1 Tax=Rhodospirillum rubrum (strain ATCC 11170 / ATH 1.1.1 / DSM 467 / LMG 4362 / NCIMB 8255 / S1) TaxID=269796 RepID=SLYX_RHORT|nr:SlyX family protein [Rhodospirillum rubrum]Q2RY87.1 RecName: Full=Protein SlyX homolog [Rhodospirillum rubrum ATCC 11170]ABC20908.1 SlyX [Rhodospirillum rubrum ATCC 11170]AEO46575.1 slyX [Rhodospirillum rubrum F11]MBK5952466.1 protein SlyX [Rhodospirillum rubrum]QXG80607.1 SlyX family protein [Rhodospirillum rubrum]